MQKVFSNTITCFCGSSDYSFVREVPYQDPKFIEKFLKAKILRCNSCGMNITSPSPNLIAPDFYEVENVSDSHAKNIELWRGFSQEIIENIKPYKKSGRFLDIGCNIGILVDIANKNGYRARGIDLNQSAIDFGVKNFDVDLQKVRLEELPADDLYDVVVMNHVIEHIVDLKDFSKSIQRIMKPDAIFLAVCPNAESYITKFLSLLNKRKKGIGSSWIWYGYLPEQHIWQFGPKTLAEAMSKSDFVVENVSARQNMHWGATELKGLKYKIMKLLWSLFKFFNKGDNLFIWCRKK